MGENAVLWLKHKPYKRAGVVAKPDPVSIDCKKFTVIVSSEPLRERCKKVPVRIDRFDLWRKGAHAVYFEEGKTRVETALDVRGLRPWVVRPVARRKILTNQNQSVGNTDARNPLAKSARLSCGWNSLNIQLSLAHRISTIFQPIQSCPRASSTKLETTLMRGVLK